MKVLKTGSQNDQLERKQITCTGKGFSNQRPCGALLEYTGLDVKRGIHHDYGNDCSEYFYIICPECNSKTEISTKELSSQMKDLATNV